MPPKEASLADVLARLDKWIGASSARARWLAAPVKEAALGRAEKELGVSLPASMRALYKWHDGESEDSPLFDAMCRDDHADDWERYNPSEPEIRFMPLADVVKAGVFEGIFDEDTGELSRLHGKAPAGASTTTLVPFLWMRAKDAAGTEAEEPQGPHDDDWLYAIDTLHEAVWLFEIANEGLEGVLEEAHDLASWLERRVVKLERGQLVIDELDEDDPRSSRNARPASELLLQFLLDRKLLEIAGEGSIPEIAKRLKPLLALKPEKRAIKEVITFFEEDDGIDEVFADDEMLRAIVVEFLD